jgi:putative MATE family efflux protein
MVITTVIVSALALFIKTLIAYTLIFGHFGFPALGVRGAAIGTAIGWAFEATALLVLVYILKTPLAGNPFTFFQFDRPFLLNVLRTTMPAAINEIAWSFGITTYNAVYARIGTDSIAAININATIEELVFVLFIGLGNACSVMVGNKIGEKDKDTAFEYSRRFALLAVMLAVMGGTVVFFARDAVVGLYNLSPTASFNLRNIMLVYSLSAWLRVFNFILFIGALRAGGDTKYAMYMELISIWFIGVPVALIGGFVLHLPVYYVYALVLLEEAVKAIVILRRFISRKWIHDLVNFSVDETSASLSTP